MPAAVITVEPPYALVKTPYHEAFVEQLKLLLPSGSRRWQPEQRRWRVDLAYLNEVVALCANYFAPVLVEDGDGTPYEAPKPPPKPPPPPPRPDSDHAILFVQPNAPPEVIIAARNALAKLYHPDLNPNDPNATEKMRKLNIAFERLRRPF